jgi:transcriptional regulator with XRE-family HTH domain
MSHTAPDFGFDSKEVNKWVASFGVPASTARNWTSSLVEEVKAKRDAEIVRLDAEGKTQREIAEVIGCSKDTVSKVKAVRNEPVAQTRQDETSDYQTSPEDLPFDEDELDTTPAYNPADDDELKFKSTTIPQTEAFKTELSRHVLTTIGAEKSPVDKIPQEDERPSDIYQLVADKTIEALTTIAAPNEPVALTEQEEGDDRPPDAELAQWWLD